MREREDEVEDGTEQDIYTFCKGVPFQRRVASNEHVPNPGFGKIDWWVARLPREPGGPSPATCKKKRPLE